ncbi:kinase that interacts with cdc31p [Microbotryomycetes sp. JL221]|nr:kinase that interacts with cdc31p [Microbotryomycetes sp. JL221]
MSSVILTSLQHRNVPVDQLFTRKELVGKGAYGGVYKGVHNPTGLVVALKVIDLDTPDDDISEIQKEVALLSEMRDAARHNITLYHGCYLHGHELWIAMDFASGGSIRTLMKSGPIEEKYIVVILREVLIALSFLHRQGIIHRDVKAANILLTQAGKILLCDFGVAAHLQTNNKRSTFIGTPLWMAPEVITDGKLYDTKADVWSLGITCYEIATGNPPYFGMEPLRACALIPRSTPAKLEGGPWSGVMRDFLSQCLQIDPTVRPSADDLSKHKWIKAASKVSMSVMRELINRYVGWVQKGGQRASLAGVESLAREDTFDIEEDSWDFDTEQEDDFAAVEPLGDEPPRSLDAQAALNNKRPPKQVLPRSHPLMRLFDEESNAYTQTKPSTTIQLPTGFVDTVKPTISIPSFDDASFYNSNPSSSSGGINLAMVEDLMTPATIRSQPFSWLKQQQPTKLDFGGASASTNRGPFADDDWGLTSFMSSQDPIREPAMAPPVPTSPSMPTIPLDRPLQSPNRRRADTAPSSDYPPLGPGIPAVTSMHSNQTSFSSSSGGHSSLFTNGSSSSATNSFATTLSSSPPLSSKPFTFGGNNSVSNTSNGSALPYGRTRPSGATGQPDADVNRPFRARQGSDAARQFKLGNGMPPSNGNGSVTESRSRAGSDISVNRKQGGKAQMTSNGSTISPSTSTISHSRQHSRSHSRSHSRTGSGILAYKLSPSHSSAQLPTPSTSTSMHAWSAPATAATTPNLDTVAPDVSPPSHWTDDSFIAAAGGLSSVRTPLYYAAQGGQTIEGSSFPFPSASNNNARAAAIAGVASSQSFASTNTVSTNNGGDVASKNNFRQSVIGRPGGAVLDMSQSQDSRFSEDAVVEEEGEREEDEEYDDEILAKLWPTGPALPPLDYLGLRSSEQVEGSLDDTLDRLAQWLHSIDQGLNRIVGADNPPQQQVAA